jgi:hypothetical protein
MPNIQHPNNLKSRGIFLLAIACVLLGAVFLLGHYGGLGGGILGLPLTFFVIVLVPMGIVDIVVARFPKDIPKPPSHDQSIPPTMHAGRRRVFLIATIIASAAYITYMLIRAQSQ